MSSPQTDGTAQIGVTGMAVMGSNIARNFAHHGYTVALHNRSVSKTDAVLAEHGSEGKFVRTETMAEFAAALERPPSRADHGQGRRPPHRCGDQRAV